MGYWTYYLLTFALAYGTQHPAFAALALVFYVARPYLPDPVIWLRTWGRIRSLESEITLNPSNMIATRDLARLHLERRRPKQAIALLESAHERQRSDLWVTAELAAALRQAGEPRRAERVEAELPPGFRYPP